eukprot:1160268-Pelagomonas_calceolata.AAC.5
MASSAVNTTLPTPAPVKGYQVNHSSCMKQTGQKISRVVPASKCMQIRVLFNMCHCYVAFRSKRKLDWHA